MHFTKVVKTALSARSAGTCCSGSQKCSGTLFRRRVVAQFKHRTYTNTAVSLSVAAACYNCGEPGHIQRDCPNPGVSSADSRACYNCGETGHLARDCPDQQVDDRECYNCGAVGHISRDCPEGGGGSGGGGMEAGASYNDSTACYKFVIMLFICNTRHATRFSLQKPVSEMTYTVSSGTLNSTIPYHILQKKFAVVVCRTILHNLSVLAIRKTMQVNTNYYIYFWKQSGSLHG